MTTARLRIIGFWVTTALVAHENVAGAIWSILDLEYVTVSLARLGYPHYLIGILGIWQGLCGVALLAPRLPRLKEWAYAGAFFNYSGAVASHLVVGTGPSGWVAPLVFATLCLASWALRPADRRLAPPADAAAPRPRDWAIVLVTIAVMAAVALLTLPPPPG
jgi:hypothetical protein